MPLDQSIVITGGSVAIDFKAGDVLPEFSAGTIHHFIPKPWGERQVRDMFERAELHLSAGAP